MSTPPESLPERIELSPEEMNPIPLLDHGYVQIIDWMGSDKRIVDSARLSYGAGTRPVSNDRALLRYLYRHLHTSPFEQAEVQLRIKAPMFVVRQWVRHRTACLGGESLLYFDVPSAVAAGGRKRHNIALKDFHRMWHEGTTHPIGKHKLGAMHLRSCDESTGEIIHTQVKDVWESGVKPIFKVTLENGNSLTMSKDHRCLTKDGWKTLQECTDLSLSNRGKVSWAVNAPALAVNGVLMHTPQAWPEEKSMPLKSPRLLRGYSRIVNIEYAGDQMTYDLEVTGPYHNFVADGFIVHNSMNEMSARYSVLPDEFYVPEPSRVQVQSQDNKQGSGEALQQEDAVQMSEKIRASGERDFELYNDLLEHNVARELARVTTPVSTYTDFVWKQNLKNLLHLLMLRADTHAQYEIRVYAEAIGSIIEKLFPLSWEAFVDYQQQSKLFTRLDLEALGKLFNHLEFEVSEEQLKEFCGEIGLTNKREQMELFEKMRRISIGFTSTDDTLDS